MSQASFNKRQREKARREKAAAKSAKRDERRSGTDDETSREPTTAAEQSALLAELAALHERFEAGTIEFEEFLAAKDELTERLQVP